MPPATVGDVVKPLTEKVQRSSPVEASTADKVPAKSLAYTTPPAITGDSTIEPAGWRQSSSPVFASSATSALSLPVPTITRPSSTDADKYAPTSPPPASACQSSSP